MRKKRILMLIGSVCLALMLLVPLAVSCGPAAPEEATEEIAALESKLAAEKAKVSSLQGDVSDLEDEIAELRAPDEVYKWRFQHSWDASETWCFEQYADIVREMSGGRIDMSVFCYGELVPTVDMPEALNIGTIEVGNTWPGYFAGSIPGANIDLYPFLWKNLDEWIAVYYEIGINDLYAKSFKEVFDLQLIGNIADDYGTWMWTDEFSCLDDLRGRTLRHGAGASTEILEEEYGVAAVWIGVGDLYTSLATGVIDGVSYGGAKGMYDMGFHEVAKYLMLPHPYLAYSYPYFMSTTLWDSLPSDLRAILTEACYSSTIYIRKYYAAGEMEAVSKMVDEGATVVTLPDEDVQAFTAFSVAKLDELSKEGPYAAEMVDIVKKALRLFGHID